MIGVTKARRRSIEAEFQPAGTDIDRVEAGCMTIPEAAVYLRISRSSAYKMAREGRLPVVHPLPRRTVVVRASLDRMLLDGTLGRD